MASSMESPHKGFDGRAARGWMPHLLPLRHWQLSPGYRAHLYRPQASSADPRAGRDTRLFNFITGYVEPRTELIAISPLTLRSKLYDFIDREIANARAGKPAQSGPNKQLPPIRLIDRLYRQRRQGGHQPCRAWHLLLRPGVPGMSETSGSNR